MKKLPFPLTHIHPKTLPWSFQSMFKVATWITIVICFIYESISEFGILPLQISSTSAHAQSCQFLFEANNIRHNKATIAVVSKPTKYIFLQLSIIKRSLASCVRLLFLALSITICRRFFPIIIWVSIMDRDFDVKLLFLALFFLQCL